MIETLPYLSVLAGALGLGANALKEKHDKKREEEEKPRGKKSWSEFIEDLTRQVQEQRNAPMSVREVEQYVHRYFHQEVGPVLMNHSEEFDRLTKQIVDLGHRVEQFVIPSPQFEPVSLTQRVASLEDQVAAYLPNDEGEDFLSSQVEDLRMEVKHLRHALADRDWDRPKVKDVPELRLRDEYETVASSIPAVETANVSDIPPKLGNGFEVTTVPEDQVWSGDKAPVAAVHLLRKDGPYLTVREEGTIDGKKVARVRTLFDPKGKIQKAFIDERKRRTGGAWKGKDEGHLDEDYALFLLDA